MHQLCTLFIQPLFIGTLSSKTERYPLSVIFTTILCSPVIMNLIGYSSSMRQLIESTTIAKIRPSTPEFIAGRNDQYFSQLPN